MAEHTKTPWHVIDRTGVVAGEHLVANTGGWSTNVKPSREENEANARFIVTACNNHDKLVEALKSVNIMLNCQLQRYSEEPWAQRVKEALKEVETQHGCSPVSMPKHYGKHRDGRIIGESTLTTE